MAKGKKGASPKTIKTTAKDLQAAIRDAAGAKQRATNANANKTNALADYALRSGFSKRSLAIIMELHALEDIKRTDLVREILMGHQMMGWGEQSDLFDDIGVQITEAAKRAEEEANARKGNASATPGLPLEALAKGIKPLEEAPARKARRGRKDSTFEGTPGVAMKVGTADSDAFLKEQIAKHGGKPKNALPGAPALDEPAQRQPETVD